MEKALFSAACHRAQKRRRTRIPHPYTTPSHTPRPRQTPPCTKTQRGVIIESAMCRLFGCVWRPILRMQEGGARYTFLCIAHFYRALQGHYRPVFSRFQLNIYFFSVLRANSVTLRPRPGAPGTSQNSLLRASTFLTVITSYFFFLSSGRTGPYFRS